MSAIALNVLAVPCGVTRLSPELSAARCEVRRD